MARPPGPGEDQADHEKAAPPGQEARRETDRDGENHDEAEQDLVHGAPPPVRGRIGWAFAPLERGALGSRKGGRSVAEGSRLASLDRRSFLLGAGAAAGWLLARGLGASGPFGPEANVAQAEALRALAASLTPRQRELILFPADHPSRQIVNTLAVLERPHLGTLLSPSQRALAEALYLSMLSPRGRDAFAGTVAIEGRLDGAVLAIYGDPEAEAAQAVIMAGHLMLRSGGAAPGGAAFGGGTAYGHQIGNERWRVPGNSFAYHGDAANRLYARLGAAERAQAVLPAPPHELVLQVQDERGSFEGVRVASLSEAGQEEAGQLLATVFSCYPEEERARALACIEGNGGLGALHVAFYGSRGFYEDMQAWGEPRSRRAGAARRSLLAGVAHRRARAPSSTSRATPTCTPTSRSCAIPRARTSARRSRPPR